MKYKSVEFKKTYKHISLISILFGIGLILLGIHIKSGYPIIVGFVILITSRFSKETYVNEIGVISNYSFSKIINKQDIWKFSDIKEIYYENSKNNLYTIIYFTKGDMSKKLLFHKEDREPILKYATKQNPNIMISH